jgi:uncharacterized membrane protein (DUF4010 family)
MEGEVLGFVVAIFLGALIGLQREYTQQHMNVKSFAGFRTFIFATILGSILGFLGGGINSLWVILGFSGILLFAIASYVVIYLNSRRISGTTQIAFVITFILGAMCTTGYVQLAVIFAIVVATFLTFKERLHGLAKKMESKEIIAMVQFALIAFVVLPFLPNKNYSPVDIPGVGPFLTGLGVNTNFLSQLNVLNPHNIWLMVIFIAGINLLGYFLVKIIGSKKGYGLLGFVGGLVSSTAVTLSMAEESKKKKNRNIYRPFFLATLVTSAVMFIRVLFEVSVVNNKLLPIVFVPMVVMSLASVIVGFLFYRRRNKKNKPEEVQLDQPFALKPALIFGLFFALILFVSKAMQILFGKVGLYATSIMSGLVDVDAMTLTMSSLAKSGSITPLVATTGIVLAAASNTLVKGGMAYFLGNKKFGRYVLFGFFIVLALGIGVLLL